MEVHKEFRFERCSQFQNDAWYGETIQFDVNPGATEVVAEALVEMATPVKVC